MNGATFPVLPGSEQDSKSSGWAESCRAASRNPLLFSIFTIKADNDTTNHGAFQYYMKHDEDNHDVKGWDLRMKAVTILSIM